MESCLTQVLQKDVGRRLQVGQEIIDYISDKDKSNDLEHDQTNLDKMVDGIASSWVNSSNFKVRTSKNIASNGKHTKSWFDFFLFFFQSYKVGLQPLNSVCVSLLGFG